MKGKRKGIVAAMLLIALLAGCGSTNGGDKGEGGSNAGDSQKLDQLTVLLDWYPNAVHSFLFAAEEQGYFRDAGLEVKLQTPADTNDALKLVASGKADLAISYQMQVAISRSEDIPIVSVAALVRHPLNSLITLESAGIASPKDLEGKSVGFPSIPLNEPIIYTMMEADGADPAKVSMVDIGWDLIPAMSTGRVDAIIGGYINHEKPLMEKEGLKLVTINPADYGVPDYYELVLTASEDGLASKADAISRFIEAAAKGQAYTASHPEEALSRLLEEESDSFPLDRDIETQSLQILLPLMDTGSEAFGSQTLDSWNSVIEWLDRNGQLRKEIKAEDAFRNLD